MSESVYEELKRRARVEARTIQGVVEWLLNGSDAGSDNHGDSPRRAEERAVAVCRCGHPGLSHRPKCLIRGCGCLRYKEA